MKPPKPFPWACVSGADFRRAMDAVDTRPHVSMVWQPFTRILILAHTIAQARMLMENYRMPKERVRIVNHEQDLQGYAPGAKVVLFLLPMYLEPFRQRRSDHGITACINHWKRSGLICSELTNAQVERRANNSPAN